MVPLLYGATKTAAAAFAEGGAGAAGRAALGIWVAVSVPLPLLGYWAHVLWPRCARAGVLMRARVQVRGSLWGCGRCFGGPRSTASPHALRTPFHCREVSSCAPCHVIAYTALHICSHRGNRDEEKTLAPLRARASAHARAASPGYRASQDGLAAGAAGAEGGAAAPRRGRGGSAVLANAAAAASAALLGQGQARGSHAGAGCAGPRCGARVGGVPSHLMSMLPLAARERLRACHFAHCRRSLPLYS